MRRTIPLKLDHGQLHDDAVRSFTRAVLATGSQRSIVRSAQPLAPADRDQFLKDVAMRLSGTTVGPGSVFRACHEAQRQFFDYPDLATGSRGKYR
jgi:hypothetical protein